MRVQIGMMLAAAYAGTILAQTNPVTPAERERVQQVLRQAIQDKDREAARRSALTNQTFRGDPDFREMERRYLEGAITAKEFRRYLQEYQPPLRIAPLVTNSPSLTQAVELLRQHDPSTPNPGRPPKPFGDTLPTQTNAPAVDLDQLEDIETKMNRLAEEKRKREQNNQLDATKLDLLAPASGLPRRDRLDLLLRMYIEGLISEPEYRVHREKIMSEPEVKPAAK